MPAHGSAFGGIVLSSDGTLMEFVGEKRRSTRHSLRNFTNGNESGDVKIEDAVKEESPLSALPSSPNRPNGFSESGKRKRSAPATSDAVSGRDSNVRRSPRKAPKLDEDASAGKRKARRQPAKHIKGPNGSLTVEPPPNWERMYDMTTAMRKRVIAPVDTMGCESLAEEHRSPQDQRLQTLVSLMLSSQTKDTVTAAAMRNLQQNLPGGFFLQSLLDVNPDELNELIGKVGFHNTKTKYIKNVAIILREKFNSDIPDTIEGLVSLPGVGPKMAYLCMSAAWGRDEGIGVDVHVHRITNLWGWHKTANAEQTRAELESWLPREKWHDINHMLVGFGQTICLPVGRRCGECDLATEKLCPSAVAGSPVKRKVKKEVELKVQPKVEGDSVVKEEFTEVKKDDVGIEIEAESAEAGAVEVMQTAGGAEGPLMDDKSGKRRLR
ncbi:DNA glycosylase [Hortaea werneckii]|nr:DNA glycosylase [Hortaea werneckii]KAI6916298.1 DNA glycosylase [Hortaea werneckii]KAI6929175.1 DNA glycosylase [Hortaea werneckii]KAI6963133.1 DNA glycosylase [Hortaea werneckii]KAI7026692.1 DNA glycosylase [Hortaea werneckii]